MATLCYRLYAGHQQRDLSWYCYFLSFRSLGDLTAATVGCTSDPEVSYTTLRPGVDHVLVMATDGVWDVLTNEQVSHGDGWGDDCQEACLQHWHARTSAKQCQLVCFVTL